MLMLHATGDLQVLIVQVNTADPTLSPRMSAKRTEPDPTCVCFVMQAHDLLTLHCQHRCLARPLHRLSLCAACQVLASRVA